MNVVFGLCIDFNSIFIKNNTDLISGNLSKNFPV